MTSWLTLHAIAAERGDGLRPELRLLLERIEAQRYEMTARFSAQELSDRQKVAHDSVK